MSLSLKIAPTMPPPTWGEIKRHLGGADVTLLCADERPMRDADTLEVDASYIVTAPGVVQTSVHLDENTSTMLSPSDWLADFGKNLPAPGEFAAAWEHAGYYITVESGMGRGPDALPVVADLASALADAVAGRVVLAEPHYFGVPLGAYTPDEFRRAPPA